MLSTSIGEGNGTPLQYSCLENPMDGGAWWAAVHGVAKSRTRLSDFTFTFHFHALEKEMATHSSVLAWRIPGGAWWAAVSGVSQSRTRLKRLRSSSAGSTLETTQTSVYGKNELRGLTWASFLLQFPSLGLKSQCWEREKQTPKWNRASSGPTHRASTPDTWRAVLATE